MESEGLVMRQNFWDNNNQSDKLFSRQDKRKILQKRGWRP